MDTVYRVAGSVARVVRSRWFAASALAVVSAVLVVVVAFNLNAVTVVVDNTSQVVLTLDGNPHRALSSAGDTMNEGDEVLAISENDVVQVNRAFDVQVTADGITTILRMTGGTVADALERAEVVLGEFDKVSLTADTAVSAGMDIQVDRVEYEEYTETEPVAYTSTVQYSGSVARGKTQVKQAGQEGVTVFLCTHQLRYAQDLCGSYGVIDHGELLALGGLEDLAAREGCRTYAAFRLAEGETLPGFERDGAWLRRAILSEDEMPGLLREAVAAGRCVYEARIEPPTLEDVYFRFVGRGEGGETV